MRPFTAAAVQVAPSPAPLTPASVAKNTAHAGALVRDCATATGAGLVVPPESVTTGFTPGVTPEARRDLVSPVPRPFGHLADRNLGLIRRHASPLLGEGSPRFRYGESGEGTGSGPEPAT